MGGTDARGVHGREEDKRFKVVDGRMLDTGGRGMRLDRKATAEAYYLRPHRRCRVGYMAARAWDVEMAPGAGSAVWRRGVLLERDALGWAAGVSPGAAGSRMARSCLVEQQQQQHRQWGHACLQAQTEGGGPQPRG